jgi:hypothetical protein
MTLSLGSRTALTLAGTAVLLPLVALAPARAASAPVVHFHGLHVVHNAATARRYLPGTSQDFKLFAAYTGGALRRVDRENHLPADCIRHAGIVVTDYTDGYAIGDVGDCGGYEALWTNRFAGQPGFGTWREVFGTQDGWYCPPLRKYKVPSALVGDSCYAPRQHKTVAYQQD